MKYQNENPQAWLNAHGTELENAVVKILTGNYEPYWEEAKQVYLQEFGEEKTRQLMVELGMLEEGGLD